MMLTDNFVKCYYHLYATVDEYTVTHTCTHTHTYNVESEVAVAADMTGCVLGTAVVQAVIIRTGTLEGERPLLVVDLMALLCQLHPVLEPLTRWPERRIKEDKHENK